MKELRYYIPLNGKPPFVEWLEKIKDNQTRIRIDRRLERLEVGHYGDYTPLSNAGGICELRFTFGPGYRIYFAEFNHTIVILLCGGDKSTQKKDVEKAQYYWKELTGE